MNLRHVPGCFSVCRLPPDTSVPTWAAGPGFWAVVRAEDEITVVCLSDRVPDGVQVEGGWACFRSVGPFAFDETGVVAALVAPLSAAGLGVFVVCTFDGEHILYPEGLSDVATRVLTDAGHRFVETAPT